MKMRMRMTMTMTMRKKNYFVNNSTNFDIFAVHTPPKTFVCCFITTI